MIIGASSWEDMNNPKPAEIFAELERLPSGEVKVISLSPFIQMQMNMGAYRVKDPKTGKNVIVNTPELLFEHARRVFAGSSTVDIWT